MTGTLQLDRTDPIDKLKTMLRSIAEKYAKIYPDLTAKIGSIDAESEAADDAEKKKTGAFGLANSMVGP
jgi:hypothetical protein